MTKEDVLRKLASANYCIDEYKRYVNSVLDWLADEVSRELNVLREEITPTLGCWEDSINLICMHMHALHGDAEWQKRKYALEDKWTKAICDAGIDNIYFQIYG